MQWKSDSRRESGRYGPYQRLKIIEFHHLVELLSQLVCMFLRQSVKYSSLKTVRSRSSCNFFEPSDSFQVTSTHLQLCITFPSCKETFRFQHDKIQTWLIAIQIQIDAFRCQYKILANVIPYIKYLMIKSETGKPSLSYYRLIHETSHFLCNLN